MSHCLPSKGTVLRLSLSNESSKVSFSHARLAHVGHKALANFFFVARMFRSRIGDKRRLSATFGDSRNVHERKRSKKSAPLGFHRSLHALKCLRTSSARGEWASACLRTSSACDMRTKSEKNALLSFRRKEFYTSFLCTSTIDTYIKNLAPLDLIHFNTVHASLPSITII